MCMYNMCMYVYICVYIYIYIYMYTHTSPHELNPTSRWRRRATRSHFFESCIPRAQEAIARYKITTHHATQRQAAPARPGHTPLNHPVLCDTIT